MFFAGIVSIQLERPKETSYDKVVSYNTIIAIVPLNAILFSYLTKLFFYVMKCPTL